MAKICISNFSRYTIEDNLSQLHILYAKRAYIVYRILLRIVMGKNKRNEYFETNHTSLGDFLLVEGPIKANGIKAIPRKHTADFEILFKKREIQLQPHFVMNNGETFVDVGANVGYYTLKTATDNGNDNNIKIVAIEAHPDNYKALCRNIAYNGFKNVILINKAVSNKKGPVTLFEHITKYNRLLTDDFSMYIDYGNKSSLQVESDTIDNILKENNIQKVDVLKMDIEGAEVLALRGATETLKKLRKIVVEVHGDKNMNKIRKILQDSNFDVKIINLSCYGYAIGNK